MSQDKCPKCGHYGLYWDPRRKEAACPWFDCDFSESMVDENAYDIKYAYLDKRREWALGQRKREWEELVEKYGDHLRNFIKETIGSTND